MAISTLAALLLAWLPRPASPGQSEGAAELDRFSKAVVSGGPPPDGIPPIEEPVFVPAGEADGFLDDEDVVFGTVHGGAPRAFPQEILVWHEIVNDSVGDQKAALTYCPLTGSAIGFLRPAGSKDTSFGTSGKLLNSNLVMYDRATKSLWPQILGRAISGPSRGTKLERFPVVWTTWRRWKTAFPDTRVLSSRTGFLRAYGMDPYGAYPGSGTYYQAGAPIFPVMASSDRFPAKEAFLGVDDGDRGIAVRKEALRRRKVMAASGGQGRIAILFDERLDTGLAYRAGDRTFSYDDGKIVDERGVAWDVWGRSDRGEQLEFVPSFEVMWFAWYSFFPRSTVIDGTGPAQA